MAEKAAVGVVGIGAMGMGVAKTLLRAGYSVRVRDIRPEADSEAASAGAIVRGSPAALARDCPIVITLVVNAEQTEEVVFGTDGLADALAPGSVVMMCSTVAPSYTESLTERLAALGILLLDAPVSGGPARAHAGTMSMMLAGASEALERCAAVLETISDKRFRVSHRPGDGSKMKIVNNMLAGVNLAAGCEAMALGMRLGLDPQTLFEVVCASSGGSWIFSDRMPRVLAGDYSTKAAVHILAKDMGLVIDSAAEASFPVPIAAVARQAYLGTMGLGHADEDDAAVVKFYATLGQVKLPPSGG